MSKETSNNAVSVVIPTKNEGQVIRECLASIFNQSLKPLEVIVVDGRSTDNTVAEASLFPVKVITETEPTSLPNARNLGAREAKGDIILIIDADVTLEKNCIKNACKYFQEPDTIAVVPFEQNVAHSKLEKIQIDWIRGGVNHLRPGIGISVFAEFLRTSVFSKIAFDPSLGYGEDDDFQRRLISIYGGTKKVFYSSNSIISVHYSHTFKELRSQYTWYGRTFRTFANKGSSIKPILNFASLVAPSMIIILCLLSIFFIYALPFLILLVTFIIARNLVICYRSRSWSFFEFVGFEFLRSIFFINGLLNGLFSKKRGK